MFLWIKNKSNSAQLLYAGVVGLLVPLQNGKRLVGKGVESTANGKLLNGKLQNRAS